MARKNDSRHPKSRLAGAEKPAASEGGSAKESNVRAVKRILKESPRRSRRKIKLPIIRSKQPGTLELDNNKIFEIISFP